MNHESERLELVRIAKSLFDRGYVHSTAGNVSSRLPDGAGYLVTPTDACLGFLEPEALAHVNSLGVHVSGARPTKALSLHREIYASDLSANCVIHTHSTALVALSILGVWSERDILPPLTAYQVIKVGHVPHIPFAAPGDPGVSNLVSRQIAASSAAGQNLRAVMLERLGPTVWHDSPSNAMALLEELTETAQLWLTSNRSASPLRPDQLAAVRDRFGVGW